MLREKTSYCTSKKVIVSYVGAHGVVVPSRFREKEAEFTFMQLYCNQCKTNTQRALTHEQQGLFIAL